LAAACISDPAADLSLAAKVGSSPTFVPRHWHAALEKLKEHPLARIGPGLITGVADDDPSGIATYSQAGAQLA
jgi:hypothetical protein